MAELKVRGSLLHAGKQAYEGPISIEETRDLPNAQVQRDGSFFLKSPPEFEAGATFDLVLEDGRRSQVAIVKTPKISDRLYMVGFRCLSDLG